MPATILIRPAAFGAYLRENVRPNLTVNRTPAAVAGGGERLVGAGYLTR